VDDTGLFAESHGDSLVLSRRGALDSVPSPRLDDLLTQAEATYQRVIIDLTNVDFLDTSALAVIVGHWKKLESGGGVLALAGARYRYTKTLWITGLADKLTLYSSVEEGLQAQAGASGPAAN
jgi:anti-sigma B factor antagonist